MISGTPATLVRQYWPDDTVVIDAVDRSRLAVLDDHPGVLRTEPGEKGVVVALDSLDRVPDLVQTLTAAGVRVTRVDAERHTLEDLYFAVRRGSGHNRIGEVHQ